MNAYVRLSVLAAAVLLLPATLSAQEHPGMGPDSMSMDATMMQPGPRMLLHQQDVLGLSGDQVRQLEELQARIEEIHQQALGVLTEEQRSNVRYGMRMMMRSMAPGSGMMGGMMQGRAGMMGRMGDMDRAPMMEMMHRMHRQMHGGDCPMAPDTAGG